MRSLINRFVSAMGIFCCGCASHGDSVLTPEPKLCKQIQEFSSGVSIGNRRSVFFRTEQSDGVLPTKFCSPAAMNSEAKAFCEWLSINMSAEFMAQNISQVMTCLTNNKNFSGKDIRVGELIGKLTISEPYKNVKNIDVDIEFSYKSQQKTRVIIFQSLFAE